jgi:hypothetical protein
MSQLQLRVAAEDPGEILRLQARRRGDRLDRPPRQLDQGADQLRQPANLLLIGIGHAKKYIRFPRRVWVSSQGLATAGGLGGPEAAIGTPSISQSATSFHLA